jgi:hypothetical protein
LKSGARVPRLDGVFLLRGPASLSCRAAHAPATRSEQGWNCDPVVFSQLMRKAAETTDTA